MRIVSPYRPFAPESDEHQMLGAFDWVGALQMLGVSAERTCGLKTVALTDVDTDLPVPSFQYVTRHRRLMLWILDVTLRYLDSDDFDQDTILVSPDSLICGDVGYWFAPKADLSLLVRNVKFQEVDRPILNSVQWFRVASRRKLVTFYQRALAIAETLPDATIRWGADSEPLRQLLEPLAHGIQKRSGMIIDCIPAPWVLESVSQSRLVQVAEGTWVPPTRAVLDFKATRKHAMATCFDLAFGAVPA